jgi:tetratricopeptide (TPR) repeat protein
VNNSNLSLSFLIEQAESYPAEDREQLFLENFPECAAKYKIIEGIINTNNVSSVSVFTVTEKAAEEAISGIQAQDYIGKIFDNWIIVDVIASTNKNIILKASPADESYDQIVAIKIPSPLFKTLAHDSHIKKQAHLMEVLKHPNLIEVKGAGTACDVDYVAMEYLSGLNIVEHCRSKNLSTKAIVDLFIDICACVENMHKYSVIHSDLKPDNIILNSSGIVKVFDFDLSDVKDEKVHTGYDYNNVGGNTEKYASPEQLISGEATTISDVFSLGQILFEMLSGEVFDLQKRINRFGPVVQAQGKNNHVFEICSVINKACEISPSERYKSVNCLIDDLNDIYSSSVPDAHKVNLRYLYRLTKKMKFYPRMSFAMTLTSCFMVFAFFLFTSEYKNSESNAKALVSAMDPRKIDGKTAFDTLADKTFNANWVFDSSQYRQLMDFGDAYYGSGQLEKAIKFFTKAKAIYPDKESPERINATSKLALSYYTQGELYESIQQIDEYKPLLFNDKPMTMPHVISLFFSAVEVNSQMRHLNWLEDGEFTVYEIMKKISLNSYTQKDEKLTAQMNLIYFKAVDIYFTIYNGDFASSSVFQSEEVFQTKTKPLLEKSKQNLVMALDILQENAIVSHREPLIYLWLGRLESELGNITKARKYTERGVKLTMKYFGFDHPRVIDALLKEFATIRFISPEKGLNSVKTALGIAKNYEKINNQFLIYKTLIDTALSHGDIVYARKTLLELIDLAKEKEKSFGLTFSDLDSLTTSLSTFTDYNIINSYKKDVMNFVDDFYYFEKKYATFNINNSMLPAVELIINLRDKKQDEILSFIRDQFRKALNDYKIKNESDIYDFRFTGQVFVDVCLQHKPCNAAEFIPDVERSFNWTKAEDKYSFDKLSLYLRLSNAYVELGLFDKARAKLAEVKPIFDYVVSFNPTSLHIASYNNLIIQMLVSEGKYAEAEKLIDKAFVIVAMHHSKESQLYKRLAHQKELLINKKQTYL